VVGEGGWALGDQECGSKLFKALGRYCLACTPYWRDLTAVGIRSGRKRRAENGGNQGEKQGTVRSMYSPGTGRG